MTLKAELTRLGTKTMQQATQLQVPPSGQSSHQPIPNLQDKAGMLCPQLQMSPSGQSSYQPIPKLQDKVGTPRPQPQHQPPASKETLLQQPDKDKTVARHIPRLRAVVESQAFKNVLVDEMDMMLSRAATLIQANWRGYRLRQKLISQLMAAKAIQEAWRRFNTRRLLRSGKTVEKRVKMEERDIPYHPPQQVRFQHPEEGKSLLAPPIMLSKETQFPSSDSLATYSKQLALLQSQGMSQPGVQATCAVGGPSVTFLPHQAVAIKLPCPVSLEAKCHPCLLTGTVRSSCVVRVEGDTTKTKPVTARANKAEATGPPPSGRYAQAVHGQLKTQTQAHMEAEVFKAPPQTGPTSVITKTPPQPVPTMTVTKTPLQMYPAARITKTPLQPCPVPMVTITKTPLQPCPAPAITITKTPPQPCPVTPMTKTPVQMRPTASVTNTSPQTRPAAVMTKIPPQLCLLASMIKSPPQTRPTATMTKTPPQTCTVPMMAKTPPQMRPAATMTKTPLQTCQAATMAKTPSHQMLQGGSVTKAPPQTRLAAMITKTPAQLRSVATILRTLCLPPPAAAENPKPSLSAAAAAGIPDTSSHTCLSGPKTKAVGNTRQAAGVVKVSSRSYLTEGKVKYFSPSHLGAGAPKVPAKPPLEGEKIKAFSQKQVKMETVSDTSVAMEIPGALSWAKVAEDRNKQAHLRADIMKIQSRVYAPVETAVVPQAQLDTCPARVSPPAQPGPCSTTISSQRHLLAELTRALPQAHLGTCLSKPLSQAYLSTKLTKAPSQGYPPSPAELTAAPAQPHLVTCLSKVQSQAHLPAKLTKAQSQAHLVTGAIKIQSQAHLPAGLTKAQSQAQLVTETAKCLHAAHQAAELSSKTQSQPLLIGFKASTQPCQHISALGTLPRAKPEDRLTQLPSHSHVQAKATQGPCQGVSETQNVLVPLLASAGHTTCNVESWGDSGATRAQPSMTSSAPPCQEELAASQLASLCAELAAVLGSQEDLRALLAKALSQGEVRAALNQALSKEVLGATMAKALPQGILGTALVKALSWGELGTTLSRALSQGELRAELTKAIQGRLADVLSKALTEEERATFNQALCQGELGAVLSQSLSQAALRSGVVLPKAASKTAGSRMTVMPTPVEVDYRGSPSAAWGPTLGSMRLQPGKGPKDAGVSGGQAWNSVVPSVAVGRRNSTVAPCGVWEPPRDAVPWDAMGSKVAVDPRQPGELVASVQAVEKIIINAVVIIQACTRGYLVRRTIKIWHQWAIIIQAAWRGYCVRRDLARLCRAVTIIQAAWRGFCTRRSHAQQMLLPSVWAEVGARARSTSDHRCFQSCQPHDCTLCRSLSSGLGSPPSVVMLVGSSPRTCHMCGHTLPTRVVHGVGRGAAVQAVMPRSCITQSTPRSPRQPHPPNKAATAIQSAWRGFTVRRRLKQQQLAAKTLQATWRGHSTRASLTTDALLGSAMWDNSRHTQWPGV
nr:IQ domain-containing protein N [Vicugna pacos]